MTRITLDDIEASIAAEHYFTAGQALAALGHPVSDGLDLLTVCVMLLRNGTKIVGINYGAIDPAQHSDERGHKEARDHAIEQIWPLLGYELRSRLHARTIEEDPKPGPTAASIGSLLAGTDVVGVDQANEQERCVRVFLEKGAVVKVEGIPLEIDHDAVVRIHPANVPLVFPPRPAGAAESDE